MDGGAAVLFMVSGGWYSNWIPPEQSQRMFQPLTSKGFTVFAVRHGSSPKFSIPEAISDVRCSVRFIRMNTGRFKIDHNRIGVFGMSAGGHLSLVLGTASDEGKMDAKDPLERVSDRVNAVVANVAPTDWRIMVKDSPDRLPAYAPFPGRRRPADKRRDGRVVRAYCFHIDCGAYGGAHRCLRPSARHSLWIIIIHHATPLSEQGQPLTRRDFCAHAKSFRI